MPLFGTIPHTKNLSHLYNIIYKERFLVWFFVNPKNSFFMFLIPNPSLFVFFFVLLLPFCPTLAQNYTSYIVGSAMDISTSTQGGTLLMGGSTDVDNAIRWLLQRANGGDVVVIRATGADGYNDYMYSELGVTVNSVETLIIPSIAAANNAYVVNQIRNAEALFIAGGDQYNYVSKWRNTLVEDALNYLINEKHVTVGGTSAGMAIQGDAYFSAQNGTVYSDEALNDPYNTYMTIGYDDFLNNPYLKNTITDTHFDNPDRRGRLLTFLARLMTDYNFMPLGIASEETTAVCIDEQGIARIFGGNANGDYAYFLRANCLLPNTPENCQTANNLTWNRNQKAVKVYKVQGTINGTNTFDLNNWETGIGGVWEHWYAQNGALNALSGTPPEAPTITIIGQQNACSGNTYTYSIQSPPTIGSPMYQWSLNGTGTILSGQSTPQITVQWTSGTTGTVNVVQTY
jgi:cyanophycinase-like exopeptidase